MSAGADPITQDSSESACEDNFNVSCSSVGSVFNEEIEPVVSDSEVSNEIPIRCNKIIVAERRCPQQDLDNLPIDEDNPVERKDSVKECSSIEDIDIRRNHVNHVFILSLSGKPVFSLHGGDGSKFASLFSTLLALYSLVESRDNDELHSFKYRSWICAFKKIGSLIYVIARRSEAKQRAAKIGQLRKDMENCDAVIVSVLTRSQIELIYKERITYDLRRLLHGVKHQIDNMFLLSSTSCDTHIIDGIRALPLPSSLRDSLNATIIQARNTLKLQTVALVICIARSQLVAYVRHKAVKPLSACDIHVLINLIDSSPQCRNAQTWSPICLRDFNENGFLHAYIAYLHDQDCPDICLMIFNTDRNTFQEAASMHSMIVGRLHQQKYNLSKSNKQYSTLRALQYYASKSGALTSQYIHQSMPSSSVRSMTDVWHFVYKLKSQNSILVAALQSPFVNNAERSELLNIYRRLVALTTCYNNDSSSRFELGKRNLKIVSVPAQRYNALAWSTTEFDLYVVMNPLTTKYEAIAKVDCIIKYVNKEIQRLFIGQIPVF